MKYKIDLEKRFEEKKAKLEVQGYENINSWNENIIDKSYSEDEELFIIKAKENGMPDKRIAEILNRPYWGVVDKLRRMKKSKSI